MMKKLALTAAVALAMTSLSGAAMAQASTRASQPSVPLVPASYSFGSLSDPSWSGATPQDAGSGTPPPTLDAIMSGSIQGSDKTGLASGVPPIRAQAIQEAAASLGARAGLARRLDQYARTLDHNQDRLDRTFNFKALLLDVDKDAAPNTPAFFNRTAAQAQDRHAYLVPAVLTDGGPSDAYPSDDELRFADRVYKIEAKAYLSPVAPNWRNYLNFSFAKVQMPNSTLLPKTTAEKALWDHWVAEGWARGYAQADQMFDSGFSRLVRDFGGMENFRIAYAQGLITRPKVSRSNLGVTGGGNEMRLGDSIRRIVDQSSLNPDTSKWLTLDPAP